MQPDELEFRVGQDVGRQGANGVIACIDDDLLDPLSAGRHVRDLQAGGDHKPCRSGIDPAPDRRRIPRVHDHVHRVYPRCQGPVEFVGHLLDRYAVTPNPLRQRVEPKQPSRVADCRAPNPSRYSAQRRRATVSSTSASGFASRPTYVQVAQECRQEATILGRVSARSRRAPSDDPKPCRKHDQRPREPQGAASVVERIIDLRCQLG